ncbi:hypothetical protein [Clostridium estertheticum]|uniref:hypothetical protein n=1 Tax=Clostridium estertheticum TaxID=238834 RepID=UPI001C0D8D7C|nr:hypothetical protein [Clostridium estertheticum]MBU3072833.1 hypothetical protein [Clostridium estertheticum]MBU3163130.1 hypothetical protein [Clostridium estertheticum]
MNNITNMKVNYMLLEQILRVTGVYKTLCDEYEFLDFIFKKAKIGKLYELTKDDEVRETACRIIENITGVASKYWSGEERIKLGIRCNNEELNYDKESIDTVDLTNDNPYSDKEQKINHQYGIIYAEQLRNPLHIEPDEIYHKISKEEESESKIEETIKNIEDLYSLRGLLVVILINMADEIELIDKANVYKHSSWKSYIRILEKPTKHGITYSPRFIEIRKGLVQTIIRNIYDLGIVFTFRDLDKEFIIK